MHISKCENNVVIVVFCCLFVVWWVSIYCFGDVYLFPYLSST